MNSCLIISKFYPFISSKLLSRSQNNMSFGGNEYYGKSASILIEVVVRFPPPDKNGIFIGTHPRYYFNFYYLQSRSLSLSED